MALDSYSGLQAAIADTLNRADLTAAIPTFIRLAEAQITRRLVKDGPIREMMGRSDATVNAEYVAVPSDFVGLRSILLTGSRNALEYVNPETISQYKIDYASKDGDPTVYSIVGGEFQFWPWAGTGSYPAEIAYWKRIPALSDANPSNWLLVSHPDAYLYASLLQSAPYLKDDARIDVWGTFATQILDDMIGADKLARTAPNIAVPYVAGGTP